MAIALTDLGNLLKEDILPEIQDQLFREKVFTAELEKNKNTTLHNWTFYVVASTGQHSGVYNIPESWTIEDGTFSTSKMSIGAKYAYWRHTFTDIALEWVSWDAWSLVDTLTLAGTELKSAMQRSINRQFEYGYGKWVIGVCWTWATGTTVTVDWESEFNQGTFYIAPWMKLLIGTEWEIEAWTAESVTVTAVTSDTTFTVASSFTYVTDDLIAMKSIYDTWASIYTEMAGFRNLIDNASSPYDTTFQGITRATNNWVNASVYKNGTRQTLTISRIREYVLKASKFGKPNLILMNHLLYDKLISLLEDQVRFTQVKMGTASFEWIAFASQGWVIPVILSFDVPLDEVYIIDLATWTIWEMSPLSFLDRDWQVLRNVWGNSNQFSAIMKFYWNLINLKPKANARIAAQKATS